MRMATCGLCKSTFPSWYWHSCSQMLMESPDARERAIRAVVAAQWAVACALFSLPGHEGSRLPQFMAEDNFAGSAIAELPCAVDVVDGVQPNLLGDG